MLLYYCFYLIIIIFIEVVNIYFYIHSLRCNIIFLNIVNYFNMVKALIFRSDPSHSYLYILMLLQIEYFYLTLGVIRS